MTEGKCGGFVAVIRLRNKTLSCSIIIDADSSSVVSRVALRNDDIPLGEQTVAQVTNAIHSLFW